MITKISVKDYDDILNNVKKYVFYKRQGIPIDIYDIAHSVIIDDNFQLSNYKHLIIREIYNEVSIQKPLCKIEVINIKIDSQFELFQQCPKCFELYLESQFYNLILCQKCYRKKNKEKIALAQKKWSQKPENRIRKNKDTKAWNKNLTPEQKENLRIYKANWYQKNKQKK